MRAVAEGELVTVRAYAEADIDPLLAAVAVSIAEIARYETWCHPGFMREDAASYVNWWRRAWADGQAYYFAVEELATGDFLGSCGLSGLLRDHRRAGLGYWIRSDRTGRGFATDAARTVMHFGFTELGLNRVELECAVDNVASRRVAEKLGAVQEGILRSRLILPAGATDTAMYAAIRPAEHAGPRTLASASEA
ncbi:MAG: GNAT family N-acetyltransferase [Caldilineaceae bacterium]|nr:GNAT family N-acetyltransferase [Caldilinea sp.]MCB0068119.1 GNAT family N-acetyltransferase [Caldilineaceae bacterium]